MSSSSLKDMQWAQTDKEWDNSKNEVGNIVNSLSINKKLQLSVALDPATDLKRLKRVDARLKIINLQMLGLSFLVVISMIISNQLCFDDEDLVYRYPCDPGALCSIFEWSLSIIGVQR